MSNSQLIRWTGYPALALILLLAGCARQQEPAEQAAEQAAEAQKQAEVKLAEAQAELDQAKRDFATAKQAAKTQPKTASSWSQGSPQSGAARPSAPAAPREYTVPEGTQVVVRTTTQISTKTHQSGQAFEATLHQPLEVDGVVLADRGATVRGQVVEADPGGRVKGVASISVRLTSIEPQGGEPIRIATGPVGQDAATSKKKDAAKVGIASGVGAAIGAIAGGGRGAAIGAGAGAAGGTGVVLATRGDAAVIPAESLLTFRLTAPATAPARR